MMKLKNKQQTEITLKRKIIDIEQAIGGQV